MTALTGSSDSNTAPRRTKTAYRDAQDQGQYGRATGRGNSRGGGRCLPAPVRRAPHFSVAGPPHRAEVQLGGGDLLGLCEQKAHVAQ